MRKIFDTRVQEIKNRVLSEVASIIFDGGDIGYKVVDLPGKIVPGPKSVMRCCIYKERAIAQEQIKLAFGRGGHKDQVVEVINIACDECPVSEYSVGNACRGCIAHRCVGTCPVNAIEIVGQKAYINPEICIECGKCMNACPYSAIIQAVRPCEKACIIGAIDMDKNKKAVIDYEKCVGCGACVYQCPFGAITDRSYIADVIKMLRRSKNINGYKVVAIVAPSIGCQFGTDIEIGQIVSGIKALGFHEVYEAALGADMVAMKEAEELAEKGFLTSSCCPAFVKYVEVEFPDLAEHISHNVSPMVETAIKIREKYSCSKSEMLENENTENGEEVKIVFIGPCIAKKEEFKREEVKNIIDSVITFEELQALFDSRKIELEDLEDDMLFDASAYGRNFAVSGGLSQAVEQAFKEIKHIDKDFKVNPIPCNGLGEVKIALLKARRGRLEHNFIEGMACVNGCIGGAACLTHGKKDKKEIELYSSQSNKETMQEAIDAYENK